VLLVRVVFVSCAGLLSAVLSFVFPVDVRGLRATSEKGVTKMSNENLFLQFNNGTAASYEIEIRTALKNFQNDFLTYLSTGKQPPSALKSYEVKQNGIKLCWRLICLRSHLWRSKMMVVGLRNGIAVRIKKRAPQMRPLFQNSSYGGDAFWFYSASKRS
jgi:hypothetical protein